MLIFLNLKSKPSHLFLGSIQPQHTAQNDLKTTSKFSPIVFLKYLNTYLFLLQSTSKNGIKKDLLIILSQKNTKEESEFLKKLISFMECRNTPIERPPMLGYKQSKHLDQFRCMKCGVFFLRKMHSIMVDFGNELVVYFFSSCKNKK